jgi:hypothetical protein
MESYFANVGIFEIKISRCFFPVRSGGTLGKRKIV